MNRVKSGGKFSPYNAALALTVMLGLVLIPAASADTAPVKTVLQTGTVSKSVIRPAADGNGSESGTSSAGPSTKGPGKGHGHGHHRGGRKHSHGSAAGHGKGKGTGSGKGTGHNSSSSHPVSHSAGTIHHRTTHKPAVAKPKPKPLLNMTAVPDVRAAAKQLVESGSLQSADWLLKKALEFNPQDTGLSSDLSQVALARAKKLIDQGYLECALIRLREALFMNPDLLEAEELINEILRKQGHDPENPDERLKLADGLVKEHRYIAAIVEYRESLKLRPSAEAFTGLGDMYAQAGQPEMARSAYQQALSVNPHYPLAQNRAAAYAPMPVADSTDLQNPNVRPPAPVKDAPPGVLLVGSMKNQSLSKYMEFARNAARTARFAKTTTSGAPRLPAVQTISPESRLKPIGPSMTRPPAKLPDLLLMNPAPPQDIDGDQLPDSFPTKISQRLPAGEAEHCACE